MEPAAVNETLDIFKALNYEQMGSLDGLSQDRKDTIVPATIVFQQLLAVVEAPSFIISNRGLREGIIIQYLNDHHNDPYDLYSVPQQTSIRLSSQYNIQEISTNQRITDC
jgi:Exopolyphosphatase